MGNSFLGPVVPIAHCLFAVTYLIILIPLETEGVLSFDGFFHAQKMHDVTNLK